MLHTKHAFTLIELLIAIVLIVSGLIALVRAMGLGIFADSNLECRLTALNLANEKIEELVDSGYDAIFIGTTTETGSAIGFDFVTQRQTGVEFVDSSLVATTTASGLKNIQVEVQWNQAADTQSVAVQTLIADY